MIILPLPGDQEFERIKFEYVTFTIFALCIGISLALHTLEPSTFEKILVSVGTTPAFLLGYEEPSSSNLPIPQLVTLVTSQFFHGGAGHIAFNMIFLIIFGGAVEDAMGHFRFLVFYLLCGVAAVLAHVHFYPESSIPLIGASGAISGVLGAYMVLFPKARIALFMKGFVEVSAFFFVAVWIGRQIYEIAIAAWTEQDVQVAFWAHVGGFIVGIILVPLFWQKPKPLDEDRLKRLRGH